MTFWKWEKLSIFKIDELSFTTKFIFVSCCNPSVQVKYQSQPLREKCPNTELILVRVFLYSVQIQENTDQK